MIRTVRSLFSLITISMLFCSCMGSKQASIERKIAMSESKFSPPAECFVVMNDGTLKNYTTLKLVTSLYKAPHLLADGKTRIYSNEITAYQNKKHFAVNANGFSVGGHKSSLAIETLPGFAVRIASGHLNVYIKKYRINGKVIDEYYLQENEGQVLVYTPELMDALIKNNPEALQFFNSNKKRIKLTKELKATAKIYNDAYFNEGNDENNNLLARTDKRKKK